MTSLSSAWLCTATGERRRWLVRAARTGGGQPTVAAIPRVPAAAAAADGDPAGPAHACLLHEDGWMGGSSGGGCEHAAKAAAGSGRMLTLHGWAAGGCACRPEARAWPRIAGAGAKPKLQFN